MITIVLHEAGKGGLRPVQIAGFIKTKWWPAVPGHYISGMAARMVQRGLLKRRGHHYSLSHTLNGNGAA
jgi:hypothetical protein